MGKRASPLSGLQPELRAVILREAHRRQAQVWPPNPWHAAMALGFAGWAQRLFERPALGPLLALAAGIWIAASRWHLSAHFDAVYSRSPGRSLRLQTLLHLALVGWLSAWLYLGIRDNGLSLRSFLLCTVAAAVATGAIVIPPPAVQLARAHVAILAAAVLAGGLRLGPSAELPLAGLSVVSFALYLLYLIETHQSERWLGFVAGQIAEERARTLEEGSTSLRQHARLEKEAVERAAALKGQFLANVSHDIRTPVAGIIGLAGLLAKEPLSPSQRERVDLLRSSATGLLRLLDDVLDLSRIEAGHLSVEQAPFQLLRPARFVLDLVGLEAREKQLHLDLWSATALPEWVLGDESRVRQVLMNLVSNAVKFTPRGSVTVRLDAAAPGVIRFSVTDTGVGIPETMRQRIFEPFSQGDPSTSRSYGGVGLGLSICRRVAESMGGSIDFSSRPGEGSRFWFTVPLAATAAPSATATRDAPDAPDTPTHRSPPDWAAAGPRRRVLVVEDNEVSRFVLVEQLRLLGCDVESGGDGETALRLAEGEAFDLVLLDLQMPGIDGFETARRLRAGTLAPGIPIVAISAHAGAQEEAQCRRSGIDRLMSKPVRDDELLELLNACGTSANRPEAPAPVLDSERVELLRRLGTTRAGGLLRELARNLATGGVIGAVQEALASEDFAAARRHIHSLRGSALNIGAARLAEAAASLETQLDAGRPAGRFEQGIEELQRRLDEAVAALERTASQPRTDAAERGARDPSV